MKARLAILVGTACVMAAVSVRAHHSFAAEFDGQKPFRVTGALVKIEWTNPHIYFYLDAKDDAGGVIHWAFSAGSPFFITVRSWRSRFLRSPSPRFSISPPRFCAR